MFTVACEHDNTHLVIVYQVAKRAVQFANHRFVEGIEDHRFVEGIEDVGSRHRDLRDAGAASMNFQRFRVIHQ